MSISKTKPIGAGEGVVKKRPQKVFFVYERVNGGAWRFKARKRGVEAMSACEQWYVSLRTRAREVVHFVGVTLVSPEHDRRKPVLTSLMRDKFCYFFIGYGPGCFLSLSRRRRYKRAPPAVSEWIML